MNKKSTAIDTRQEAADAEDISPTEQHFSNNDAPPQFNAMTLTSASTLEGKMALDKHEFTDDGDRLYPRIKQLHFNSDQLAELATSVKHTARELITIQNRRSKNAPAHGSVPMSVEALKEINDLITKHKNLYSQICNAMRSEIAEHMSLARDIAKARARFIRAFEDDAALLFKEFPG